METPRSEAGTPANDDILSRYAALSAAQGLSKLSERLLALREWTRGDQARVEELLGAIEWKEGPVYAAASHLLRSGGKRIRPICVALASKLGTGFGDAAQQIAVAAELVHNASLLHDDVVDLGTTRRGVPTSRVLFGNVASIYAGDFLLVSGLRRVVLAGVEGVADRLLATLQDLIQGETLQLERRGKVVADRASYLTVVELKTASLLRWAMWSGGCAGGLGAAEADALAEFGLHLGIAFQVTDDLIDLTGDPAAAGKEVLTDLRQGRLTLPLIIALERRPELKGVIEGALAADDEALFERARQETLAAVKGTAAVDTCRSFAQQRMRLGLKCLAGFRAGPALTALETIAVATTNRVS